jgi:hypothetical protein
MQPFTARFAVRAIQGDARVQGVGPAIRVTLCDLRVLMDQPTKAISSYDGLSRHDSTRLGRSERWRHSKALWTVKVVLVGVLSQHRSQLSASEDQHPVQHLTPNRADPALRMGVRPRRPYRRAQHLDPLGGKNRVERGAELHVPITDQEPKIPDAASRPMRRLRACCVTHAPTGYGVTPSRWTRRVATRSQTACKAAAGRRHRR